MELISPELLKILVCPETHQPLTLAPEDLVQRLADLQAQGQLKNRAGAAVNETIQGALLREDGAVAYLISDSIPIMLVDEAIPLEQIK